MRIRLARHEDATAMAHVIVDTFLLSNRGILSDAALRRRKEEWTYEVSARNWQRALAEIANEVNPHDCIYVAEDQSGEIVGISVGCPSGDITGDIGEISALYVRESSQRQGVGRALLLATATHLAGLGMTKLHIRTQIANSQSRHFYEKLGGEMIGTAADDGDGELLPLAIYEWANIQVLTGKY